MCGGRRSELSLHHHHLRRRPNCVCGNSTSLCLPRTPSPKHTPNTLKTQTQTKPKQTAGNARHDHRRLCARNLWPPLAGRRRARHEHSGQGGRHVLPVASCRCCCVFVFSVFLSVTRPPRRHQTSHSSQTHPKKSKRHVKPHALVAATALGNRLFILNVAASSSRQWKKFSDELEVVQKSFFVPLAK